MVPLRRQRRRIGHPGKLTSRILAPNERPHEALDQRTPAVCYTPSPRLMPDRPLPLEYPDRFEVRYVSANGGIRWNSRWVNVSTVRVGEYVGLEEIADGVWHVVLRGAPVRAPQRAPHAH